MKIEKDDFEQWRDHPVTEQVFAAVRKLAERSKEKWVEFSWGGGNPDPLMLADLRARAEIANDLCELTFEEFEELHEERERNSSE